MLVMFFILSVVIFDQISKYFAVEFLLGNGNVPFIPGLLSFEYHENSGAAWGILADSRWVFMTVSVFAILLILSFFVFVYWKKIKISPLLTVSLSFFCGGGIGNMIDRIFLGYVVDFLCFDFMEFPIFNVADSFICIGAGLVIVYIVLDSIREYKEKKEQKNV